MKQLTEIIKQIIIKDKYKEFQINYNKLPSYKQYIESPNYPELIISKYKMCYKITTGEEYKQ